MIDLLKQQSLDLAFLRQINEKKETVKQINKKLQVMTGVQNFFKNSLEMKDFKQHVSEHQQLSINTPTPKELNFTYSSELSILKYYQVSQITFILIQIRIVL